MLSMINALFYCNRIVLHFIFKRLIFLLLLLWLVVGLFYLSILSNIYSKIKILTIIIKNKTVPDSSRERTQPLAADLIPLENVFAPH